MTRIDIAILMTAITVLMIAALAGNAEAAETGICVDTKRPYIARALNAHDVFVQSTLGKARPAVRVTTSCYHLQSAIGFGINTEYTCLSRGDTVVANLMSEHQPCTVTAVVPYTPQKDDIPEKK